MRLEEMPVKALFQELRKTKHAYKFSSVDGKTRIEVDDIPDADVYFSEM